MFGRDRWKNRAKRRKYPISLGLEGEILQFVSETLEQPPLHFSDDQFAPLIPKISNKIEKKQTVFLDQFRTVPFTFRLSPKLWAKFVILLHLPMSFALLFCH